MAVPTAVSGFTIQVGVAISFSVTFSLVPYAYETGSDQYQAVSNGLIISNPRSCSSLPLWHVKGTGNGSFVLNGVTYNFLGLNGDLYVDSDSEEVYDAANNYQPGMAQFDNYAFPVLDIGKNTFGTVTNISLEVMPRWRTLL
jgi:phage-related protein